MTDDHHVSTYQDTQGKFRWRITVGDNTTASDLGTAGFDTEKDCLAGLFGNFFGQYDESFLELYAKWQSYANQEYDVPPEAEPGIPVAVRKSGTPGTHNA